MEPNFSLQKQQEVPQCPWNSTLEGREQLYKNMRLRLAVRNSFICFWFVTLLMLCYPPCFSTASSCEACPISSAQMLLNLTSKNARPHLKSNCHLQDLYEIPCPKYFSPVLITDHRVSWWDDTLASDWLQNSPKQHRNPWVLMPLTIKILRECMFLKLLILHK